jgi:hypothetical protein
LAVAVAGWEGTCAGVYVASRRLRNTASAQRTLFLVGLPLAVFCAMAVAVYAGAWR